MTTPTEVPLEISGYLVLPLSLPPLPSFTTPATHFLYLAKHQPRVPTVTTSRSLYLVNVPFDATDAHIKRLLSTQLELPNGRIENVHFEGEKSSIQDRNNSNSLRYSSDKKGRKRKRPPGDEYLKVMQGAELPSTWDRQLRGIGRSAVIVFVDQASLDAVIRATKKTRKDKKEPMWGEGVEDTLPSLGLSRTSFML
jgi:ribosomal RNA-processing protein 7